MEKKVINIIADTLELNKDDITVETNLVRDLDVESLDLVDLVSAFEKEFDVEIADKDIKDIQTVGDVVEYIEKHNV